jgi:Podovirus DNA encapsidation protein (Gp16).
MQSKYINLRNFLQEGYTTTFILGARGVGKTVNAFLTMIDEFKKTGRKGVYLRRYDTEIDTASINFKLINQLSDTEITRDNVELDGVRTDVILVDDEPAIYMCSLSTAWEI